MHKFVALYHPPEDPQAFREYYERSHIPLAAKLPGMRGYRYAFDVGALGSESPYFAVFEAEFDDARAMYAALESPEGKAVVADVPNYTTRPPVLLDYEV